MRIIQSGNQAKVPAWTGKELECKNCGCKFMLESVDVVKVESKSSGHDLDYIYWTHHETNCPSCTHKVIFN